jgi:hypothetical protein
MFDTLAVQIGAVFVVAVCTFSFLKGDELERFFAGIFILFWFGSLVVQAASAAPTFHWGVMLLDSAMLILLIWLSWKSSVAWPAWAASCQILIVLSHLVSVFGLAPQLENYIAVVNLAGYGVLIALGIGTFWAWQERRASEFTIIGKKRWPF